MEALSITEDTMSKQNSLSEVKVNPDTLASFQNSIMEWLGESQVEEEKEPNDLVPSRCLSRSAGRTGARLSTPRTLSATKSGLDK